ncbi:MAG: hypothetical protein HZB38_17290 [Planctomycetes bacterium]|nr:hypothetical protein [Planctomycetota bacterium]
MNRLAERRRERRNVAGFTLDFQRSGTHSWTPAWVVDCSGAGAAFLTMDENAPELGERIVLGRTSGVPILNGAFPSSARVTRIDDSPGLTRKIGIVFDSPTSKPAIDNNAAARDARAHDHPNGTRAPRGAGMLRM